MAISAQTQVSGKQFAVYILASKSRRLYVGMTSNLLGRVQQHRKKEVEGFTKRYNIDRLVYFEFHDDAWSAINREKEIKGWRREKKIDLIESANPVWHDMWDDFFEE